MSYSVSAYGGDDRFTDRAHKGPVFQKLALVHVSVYLRVETVRFVMERLEEARKTYTLCPSSP